MSYNPSPADLRASYHDAPETIRSDQSHNAPETVPSYSFPEAVPHDEYYAPDKTLYEVNPKVMEVGMGTKRRLGDMSARRFWFIFGFVCAIVIAASVGGAVGGSLAVQHSSECSASSTSTPIPTAGAVSSTSSATSLTTSTSSTSTSSSSSIPTVTAFPSPSNACQNGTTYNSLFQTGENGIPTPGTGLTFTRLCGQGAALNNIGSAFVYTLEDCIEICAGINFWPRDRHCAGVIYKPVGKGKPVNCWASSKIGASTDDDDLFMGVLQ